MKQTEFVRYLMELLAPFGGITVRAMFGGFGVYHDQLMFGLVADDTLYLKVDAKNREEFIAAGAEPFVYEGKGKAITMSYFRCPEAALDSPAAMQPWARSSIAAAMRVRRPPKNPPAKNSIGAREGIALNRASYDAIAAQWDAARQRQSTAERRLFKRFATYVPEGGHVLDLGCGTGRPIAAHFLRQGFHVTGVDQSSALLAIAQQRLPTGEWHRQSIEKYTPKRAFDGIVAWDSLFHIPRTRHARIFERLRRALTPGAPFLLTLGGSTHPAFTDVMFDQLFFYDSFPPEAAAQFLRDTGFAIEINEYLDRPETDADGQPVGRNKGRIVLLARAL